MSEIKIDEFSDIQVDAWAYLKPNKKIMHIYSLLYGEMGMRNSFGTNLTLYHK